LAVLSRAADIAVAGARNWFADNDIAQVWAPGCPDRQRRRGWS